MATPAIEAVLVYRPHGLGTDGAVPLGTSGEVAVLRALRDALLEQARRDAALWREVDAGLLTLKTAELQRLARVLATLLPDDALRPDLRLIKEP